MYLKRTFCFDCRCSYCTSPQDPSCAIICSKCKEMNFSFQSVSSPWSCNHNCGYNEDHFPQLDLPFKIPKSTDSLLQVLRCLDARLPITNFFIRKLRSLLLERDHSCLPQELQSQVLSEIEKFLKGQALFPESNLRLMLLYCDAAAIASDFSAFEYAIKWYKLSLENCMICYGSSSDTYRMIDARLVDLLLFLTPP